MISLLHADCMHGGLVSTCSRAGQGATTANANAENTYTSIMADLTDPGQAYAALAGCDAVVHMAAWANAGMVTDPRTFNDNTSALFNVLQAAAGALGASVAGPA